MGVPRPPNDEYELSGQSLWPYFTGKTEEQREWIYGFKGPSQMARGQHLLRDGNAHWYDVSKVPANLDNFPRIETLATLTSAHHEEQRMIKPVLKHFARKDVGWPHQFHGDSPFLPGGISRPYTTDSRKRGQNSPKRHFSC